MTTDNRIPIDACDAVGTWTGSTTPALNTTMMYQNTGCLEVQATNTAREWYVVIGSTGLASKTIYFLVKAGNPTTKAAGGIRAILGDGTNRRAYYVGGNDDYGLPLLGGWSCFRLDTDNLPAAYSQNAGSGAPSLTAITQVGVGILNAAKATGSSPNTYFDRISYIANGSPAFRVNLGTSGAPITFANLVTLDQTVTNGWGFFNNPIAGSKQYGIYGSVTWGDDAAESYFQDADAQVYFIGSGLSAGTMNQAVLGKAAVTNSLVWDNCVMVAIGAVPNWTLTETNHNILKITNSQFKGHGTFALPTADDSNKYITGTIFDTCGKITASTLKFEYSTVKNCAGDALLVASASHELKYNTFSGNAKAVEFNPAGTYGLTGDQFSGNTKDIHFSATTGNLIINCGGSPKANPSDAKVQNDSSGTVTINKTVNVTITVKNTLDANVTDARVLLKVGSGGNYPYQAIVTIVSSGGVATVTHGTHGLVVDEYIEIAGADQKEYNGVHKITGITAGTYTYTISGAPASPATGTITSTFVILSDVTVAGVVTAIMRYKTLDQPFTGKVRKTSATPLYKQGIISGTIANANYSTTVYLVDDE